MIKSIQLDQSKKAIYLPLFHVQCFLITKNIPEVIIMTQLHFKLKTVDRQSLIEEILKIEVDFTFFHRK